jgi:tetratricopeptide (TPR) repeat protein
MAWCVHKEEGSPAPDWTGHSALLDALAASWRFWLPRALLIVATTVWIYWPALGGGFIWDDKWYVTTNPLLRDSTGLWKFWFQPGSWVEYYPLHQTLLWLQWQLWGEHTLGYHLTSVALHIVSALLVWRLLARLGLRLAWLGGLIFAVHPVQVASVAWIVEFKNTVSLPFFLLAMCAWIDFDEHRRTRDYQRALVLFLIAMLGKITMAPFPVIILLYSWWKRGRVDVRDLIASAPFFVISLVLGFTALYVGTVYEHASHSQVLDIPLGGTVQRITRAGVLFSFYFAKCLLPIDLSPIYPKWPIDPRSVGSWLPCLVWIGVFSVAWIKRRTWGRHVLLGLGFFALPLVPFLGFKVVSYMEYSWVELPLLYIPLIGLIGLVVAALGDPRLPRAVRAVLIFAMVFSLVLGARGYAMWFVGDEIFWTRTLERNPGSWMAHFNLGSSLLDQKRYDEAVEQLNQAAALQPDYADIYLNLGIALDKLGRPASAEAEYRKAISLNPANPDSYLNLGEMLRRQGNITEAETVFRQGLKMAPENEALCIDLGGILFQGGRASEAVSLYQRAIDLNPGFAQLQYNLGIALLEVGDVPRAADHLATAVELDPKLGPAHASLAIALARAQHFPEAIDQFQAAIANGADSAETRDNLALALAQSSHIPEAIEQFKKALELDPSDAKAKDGVAKLQQYQVQQK